MSIALLAACSSDSEDSVTQGGQSSITPGAAGSAGAESGGSGGALATTGGVATATGGASEATGGASEATGGASQVPRPPTDVPVIDTVFAAIDDTGAIAVEFEGQVGIAQVRTIHVQLLDAAGNELGRQSGWGSWLARPNRFSGTGSSGHLEQSGARFKGFISFQDTTLAERPERVRINIDDIEETPGPPVEAALSAPSPVARAEGAVCDPFGILTTCEGAALCDEIDGSTRVAPTCQTPGDVCPKDVLELRDTLEASNEDSPDDTYASCTFSRGNLGNDQGHVFVASRAGTHRFRAESIRPDAAVTLFARRI
jgi:hypothetical protein